MGMARALAAWCLLLPSLALCDTSGAASASARGVPPPSPRGPDADRLHGQRIADPYRWLENSSSVRTHEWIAAQQRYTSRLLDHRPELGLVQDDVRSLEDLEVPETAIWRNGALFLLKKQAGQQIASLTLRAGLHGPEKQLIDARTLSPDAGATLELLNVSKDGKLVAFGVRRGGQDQLSIHFDNAVTGKILPDVLPEARYIYWSLLFSPDGKRIFYIRIDDDGPRLYMHTLGAPPERDTLLFGGGLGAGSILEATLSADGRLLLLQVLHGAAGPTDLYLEDADGDGAARALARGIAANFDAKAADGQIYIQTDWKAPRGRIMVADASHPEIQNWRTLIPEQADTLQSFHLAQGKLFLDYLHDAHSRLVVYDHHGKEAESPPLPGLGTVSLIDSQSDSPIVCFSYSSFGTPSEFLAYSVASNSEEVVSAPTAPHWLSELVTDQVWYRSADGTRVPMFLAHKRGLARDGRRAVLLYGYGGFNWAQTPEFSPEEAVWLEHGGIYAVANIRGGGAFGEAWHKGGDLANKQNSFDDFAAAARWLEAHRYTNRNKLAIQGMSNGGLLVLASITQHPELFAAVIARYALADMLRYEHFGIARWWVKEYGSVANAEQFRTLYAYSPYQHVRNGRDYPAVLLVTGAKDTRVNPMHSLKMTAALQNATASGRPVLLLYDSQSGHSGTLPARAEIQQAAKELTFLFWQLGIGGRELR